MSEGAIMTAVISVLTGIVWLVRLEGRINGHDREIKQTRDDIAYIRGRIDRAIEDRND
jgi:hypothetical protein